MTSITSAPIAGSEAKKNKEITTLCKTALLTALIAALSTAAGAQTLTETLPVGTNPYAVAVNPVTNKVYVANDDGTVTVIDATAGNSTIAVGKGAGPYAIAVNSVTNKIYVPNYGSSSVTIIDGATNGTKIVAAGTNPRSVAINPITNQIYVANVGSANVTVIDGSNDSSMSTVAVGSAPDAVAVNTVTNKIYVANLNSSSVTVIDGTTSGVITTVATGTNPSAIAVNPVTNKIYVANYGSNTLTVIDGASNTPTTVGTGANPVSVAVNPVTNLVYVANNLSNSVTVIDGASNHPTNVSVGSFPASVSVNPSTNKIYVADNGGGESVIDGVTYGVTSIAAPGNYPTQAAVNPVTNKIYISNYGSSTVTVVDGAVNSTVSVPVGSSDWAVAVNPVTNKFYVTNNGIGSAPGSVTVIDGSSYSPVALVPVGTLPEAIAVNPMTNTIYVANKGSNTVTIISGADNSAVSLSVGSSPEAIAVNPVTNKIYVVNAGVYPTFNSSVTVINGADYTSVAIPVGSAAGPLVVNPVTNQIYVVNGGLGSSAGGLTAINGADNTTTPNIPAGYQPSSIALNPVTNQIYVASFGSSTVTVIDGASYNTTATLSSIPSPNSITVNPITNQIYVTNYYDTYVTVIDGASTSWFTVGAGSTPTQVLANPTTNKIYVANFNSNTVTVIDGATYTTTIVPTGANPRLLAVNPVTNQICATNYSSANVTFIAEEQVQQVPLTTSIGSLANNQTGDSNPGFNFSASSAFNPTVTTPDQVVYQVDTWQGAWRTASGSNPSYVGTLSSLQPGFHILYAYAGDGQQATSTQASSPLTGTITAYAFLVTGSATLLPQTVTFVNLPAEGGTGHSITLSATASTPVTFSSPSSPAICSVAGSTLTFNGTGICTVIATAAETNTYQAATTSQNIAVLAGQTITFGAISNQTVGLSQSLQATASSGLPVMFTSSTTGICTVSGTTATFLAAGTCTIQAMQAGNGSYAPATPVTQSFTVTAESGFGFIPVTPCRVVDTRGVTGSLGGPTMSGHSTRSFPLPMGSCGLPATASAYSVNVTVVPHTKLSYLTVWPTGYPQPLVSTLNSLDGRVVANAAIVPAGTKGDVSVYVTDETDVIIDINGYFADAGSAGALSFVPVLPCRVEDTRKTNGPFGGPILSAGSSRSFAIPSSGCGIPSTASAYSLNATVAPTSILHYLTLYPAGSSQPDVSTLNSDNGQVVANAAIVPAGTSGAVEAYVTDQTHLITDINGYFTSTPLTPLVFKTVTPCRVADTRNANGTFGGPIMAADSTRSFPIPESECGIPSTATAYALNVTVVPTAALNYLTLWPAGEAQPTVSTLNSVNGQVVANAALTPAGTSGAVDVFVTNPTHIIIDIVGYFSAP